MKLLLPILLMLAMEGLTQQTGKHGGNVSVSYYFTSTNGVHDVIINNRNQCESVIEITYKGVTKSVILPAAHNYKYQIIDSTFQVFIRNSTQCDSLSNTKTVEMNSTIKAESIEIGSATSKLIKSKTKNCDK
jgi:hypothetical protein